MRNWISALLVALVILCGFFYISSHREEFRRLLTLNVWQYVILSSLVLSGIVINGLIMKILVEFLGVRLRTVEWLGLSAITSAGNYLFFRGGALTKAVYLKKIHRFPLTDFLAVFGVVHCMSFLLIGVLGIMGSIVLYFTHSIFSSAIFAVFVLVSVCTVVFMLSVPEKWPLNIKFVRYLNKVSKNWRKIKNSRTVMVKLTVMKTLHLLVMALLLWTACRFLLYKIVFSQALLLALLGAISVLLTLVPAGLGIREAVIGFSSRLLGSQVSIGVTAASLGRAIAIIWVSLLGAIFAFVLSWQAARGVRNTSSSIQDRNNI